MTVRVRPATVGDLAQVFAIDRESETAPHWSEAEYTRIVERRGTVLRCLLVAETACEVLGFAAGMAVAGPVLAAKESGELCARRFWPGAARRVPGASSWKCGPRAQGLAICMRDWDFVRLVCALGTTMCLRTTRH